MEPIQRKPFVPRRQAEQPVETPKVSEVPKTPEPESIAVISHPPAVQGASAFLAPAKVEKPMEITAPGGKQVTADNIIYWVRKHPVKNAKAHLGGSDRPDYLELQLEHGIVIRVEGIIKVTLGPGQTI